MTEPTISAGLSPAGTIRLTAVLIFVCVWLFSITIILTSGAYVNYTNAAKALLVHRDNIHPVIGLSAVIVLALSLVSLWIKADRTFNFENVDLTFEAAVLIVFLCAITTITGGAGESAFDPLVVFSVIILTHFQKVTDKYIYPTAILGLVATAVAAHGLSRFNFPFEQTNWANSGGWNFAPAVVCTVFGLVAHWAIKTFVARGGSR